jgi:hypothetical protein
MSSTAPPGGLSKCELWYGRAQEPAAQDRLTAGPLDVEVEGPEIRSVRLGELELLRNVYMALRDEEWGTVPGTMSDHEIMRGHDEFAVSFQMTHRQPPVSFEWKGRIAGDRSGVISYEFDGVANDAFKYCRIGFCLLHPPQAAGHPYRGRSPKGEVEGTLPLDIGPQRFERGVYWPLFPSVSELVVSVDDGVDLELVFEGDLFETEDQRNWTDASFKTYCTPQELGYPFDADAGEHFHQKITFKVAGRPERVGVLTAAGSERAQRSHRIDLDFAQTRPLPPIGVALPRAVDHHSDAELALLRAAQPGHLRVELVLAGEGWAERLAGATRTAEELGCPLEVAAFAQGQGQGWGELDALIDALGPRPVSRLLLFAYGQEMSDPAMARHARERAAKQGFDVPVIGGTDLWFAELNRDRPDVSAVDGLVYTMTPQVHTFDEQSIAQSLEAQPDTVRTATTFAGGLPIIVSPITLRPRDAVHIDHYEPADAVQEIPFSVDPRQSSLFAAGWTVGSISALAGAGAASLTYYETVGWRGIIPGDQPLPRAFVGASPGGAFAVYHILADVLEVAGEGRSGTMLARAWSTRASEVCAVALRSGELMRVLVANLTPAGLSVEVAGLPAAAASVRMLDEHTANDALAEPLSYRSRAERELVVDDGSVSISLSPFAVARLDARSIR